MMLPTNFLSQHYIFLKHITHIKNFNNNSYPDYSVIIKYASESKNIIGLYSLVYDDREANKITFL